MEPIPPGSLVVLAYRLPHETKTVMVVERTEMIEGMLFARCLCIKDGKITGKITTPVKELAIYELPGRATKTINSKAPRW